MMLARLEQAQWVGSSSGGLAPGNNISNTSSGGDGVEGKEQEMKEADSPDRQQQQHQEQQQQQGWLEGDWKSEARNGEGRLSLVMSERVLGAQLHARYRHAPCTSLSPRVRLGDTVLCLVKEREYHKGLVSDARRDEIRVNISRRDRDMHLWVDGGALMAYCPVKPGVVFLCACVSSFWNFSTFQRCHYLPLTL